MGSCLAPAGSGPSCSCSSRAKGQLRQGTAPNFDPDVSVDKREADGGTNPAAVSLCGAVLDCADPELVGGWRQSPAQPGRIGSPQCPLANCCQAQVTLFFQLVRLILLALFISSKILKSFWEATEGLEEQTIAILLLFLAFELSQLQILCQPQTAREHAGAISLSRALAAARMG